MKVPNLSRSKKSRLVMCNFFDEDLTNNLYSERDCFCSVSKCFGCHKIKPYGVILHFEK